MTRFFKNIASLLGPMLSLMVLSISTLGQNAKDSTEVLTKEWPMYFTLENSHHFDTSSIHIDTSLNGLDLLNPVQASYSPFLDLGQLGSPIYSIEESIEPNIGFKSGLHSVEPYLFNAHGKMARTSSPITRLGYSQGGGEMLYLTLEHHRNIFDRWHTALDYRRIKNQSIYYSNISNIESVKLNDLFNLRFNNHYYTANRKYEVVAGFAWNQMRTLETGGIQDISLFETLEGRNLEDNNRAFIQDAMASTRNASFSATQFYRPQQTKLDSAARVAGVEITDIDQQFFHTIELNRTKVQFEYNRNDTPYVGNYVFTPETKDSSRIFTILNEVGFTKKIEKYLYSGLVGANHIHYSDVYGSSLRYSNTFVKLSQNKREGKFCFKNEASYYFTGYNQGDASLWSNWTLNVSEDVSMGWFGKFAISEPSYSAQRTITNLAFWRQDLDKEQRLQFGVKGSINSGKTELDLDVRNNIMNSIVYYEHGDVPKASSAFNLLTASFKIKLNHEHVYLVNNTRYASQSHDLNILGIPSLFNQSRIAIQGKIFKGNMTYQTGVNINYFSAFNALRYDPLTRVFGIQDEVEIGGTPYIDYFFEGKVKTMRVFVKMVSINQNLFSKGEYYGSPYYPVVNRSIQLGIFWDLFN